MLIQLGILLIVFFVSLAVILQIVGEVRGERWAGIIFVICAIFGLVAMNYYHPPKHYSGYSSDYDGYEPEGDCRFMGQC